jgi:hypothetical protein
MSTTSQSDWPIEQRDFPTGALIREVTTFSLQVQDQEDGRWTGPWGGVKSDRDEMTRVQAFRAKEDPKEKRRVIRRMILDFVDEVEGDGEGETSRTELLARNDENTARLIKEKAAEQAHASEEGA